MKQKREQRIRALFSEELEAHSLMHLTGGTDGTTAIPSTHPHDLVTPAVPDEPYETSEVDELGLR